MVSVHYEYFEGPQRIQREAVMEVLQSAKMRAPGRHLFACEAQAIGRFGRPVLVLRRRSFPDITVKIAR